MLANNKLFTNHKYTLTPLLLQLPRTTATTNYLFRQALTTKYYKLSLGRNVVQEMSEFQFPGLSQNSLKLKFPHRSISLLLPHRRPEFNMSNRRNERIELFWVFFENRRNVLLLHYYYCTTTYTFSTTSHLVSTFCFVEIHARANTLSQRNSCASEPAEKNPGHQPVQQHRKAA